MSPVLQSMASVVLAENKSPWKSLARRLTNAEVNGVKEFELMDAKVFAKRGVQMVRQLMKYVNTAERRALQIITAAFLKEESADVVVCPTLWDKNAAKTMTVKMVLIVQLKPLMGQRTATENAYVCVRTKKKLTSRLGNQ